MKIETQADVYDEEYFREKSARPSGTKNYTVYVPVMMLPGIGICLVLAPVLHWFALVMLTVGRARPQRLSIVRRMREPIRPGVSYRAVHLGIPQTAEGRQRRFEPLSSSRSAGP